MSDTSTTATTTTTEDIPFVQRIRANPRPALIWGVVMVALLALEIGAIATVVVSVLSSLAGVIAAAANGIAGGPVLPSISSPIHSSLNAAASAADSLPTLLSRTVIPNQGYQTPNGVWHGTFLGLEPMLAWLIRLVLVYTYLFVLLWWVWRGFTIYTSTYRFADWTPRDDMVRRMRTHRWGQFGLIIVLLFVGMAIFAPTIGPATAQQNIYQTTSHQIKYYDAEDGEIEEITVLNANLATASQGAGSTNTGVWQYDEYDRFHPFGTLSTPGADLFVFMVYGARISLFIGVLAIAISSILAAGFGLLSAYYKGAIDLSVVLVSDSIQSLPGILLLILVSVVFQNHWLGQIYNGGFVIAVAFGVIYWPGLWRAVRGPALQVAEQEWVDAAKSYGQRSTATMRKHMLPYILGYLLIYGSLTIGGVIIGVASLSFLGIGINPPTPGWGRAIAAGQTYVTTPAWHMALIPGIAIVIVVTGFNALGDGIRDVLDPESEGEETSAEAAAAGGGA